MPPIPAVQTTFFDAPGAGYEGDLADYGSFALVSEVRTFIAEDLIVFGRGVVKGAPNAQRDHIETPFAVKSPVSGSVAADFVGIAVRLQASSSNALNEAVPVRAPTVVTVAEVGSGAIIFARATAAVVNGDPVYMSVSSTTIPVGGFSNAAGTGLILLTGATWYGAAAAGTVGRIKL